MEQLEAAFENIEQRRDAHALGMWVFLATEVMFFGGLLAACSIYRYKYSTGFEVASSHLNLTLGSINTGLLLCSSLAVALGVNSVQRGRDQVASLYLILTIALGACFLTIKGFEYSAEIHEGFFPGSLFTYKNPATGGSANEVELFFIIYFIITAIHALHMIIGLIIFFIIFLGLRRGKYSSPGSAALEWAGLYWHFVDIVWLFLFPLLYLVGH